MIMSVKGGQHRQMVFHQILLYQQIIFHSDDQSHVVKHLHKILTQPPHVWSQTDLNHIFLGIWIFSIELIKLFTLKYHFYFVKTGNFSLNASANLIIEKKVWNCETWETWDVETKLETLNLMMILLIPRLIKI